MGASHTLADSVAAADRPPIALDGLTPFLRKEYYRKLGVYINRARDEQSKLLDFWKSYVSTDYRKMREEKILTQKLKDPFYEPKPFTVQRQAVPTAAPVKSTLDRAYDSYSKAKELDVAYTLSRDLGAEAEADKQLEFNYAGRREELVRK